MLHTWGQNLHLHPHLHCVVPGGGLSPDGARWIGCKKSSFFLPVQVLSSRFRNLFLIYLRKSFEEGRLAFYGEMAGLSKPAAFNILCRRMRRIKWVVFAKPPFGSPEQVLKYLARYTHRVALSNSRLLSLEDGCVTFRWKDYAADNQTKVMKLDAVEFIRRFLLHILPSRALLGAAPEACQLESSTDSERRIDEQDRKRCPVCGVGRMIRLRIFQAACEAKLLPRQDSS